MKVILLKDIGGLGQKFAVKDLASGYANHLIRTGAAQLATNDKVKNLEAKQQAHAVVAEKQHAKIAEAIAKIKAEGVSILAKVNEQGHLFEGITAEKIREAIVDSIVEIPKESILLEEPIKEAGEYTIEIATTDTKDSFKLVVAAAE